MKRRNPDDLTLLHRIRFKVRKYKVGLAIEVYDGPQQIARGKFFKGPWTARLWEKDKVVEAVIIEVEKPWQRKGVASAIYRKVEELGYTIHPSSAQTPSGHKLWQGGRWGKREEVINSGILSRWKTEYARANPSDQVKLVDLRGFDPRGTFGVVSDDFKKVLYVRGEWGEEDGKFDHEKMINSYRGGFSGYGIRYISVERSGPGDGSSPASMFVGGWASLEEARRLLSLWLRFIGRDDRVVVEWTDGDSERQYMEMTGRPSVARWLSPQPGRRPNPSGKTSKLYRGLILSPDVQNRPTGVDVRSDSDVVSRIQKTYRKGGMFGAHWTSERAVALDFAVGEAQKAHWWEINDPTSRVIGVVIEVTQRGGLEKLEGDFHDLDNNQPGEFGVKPPRDGDVVSVKFHLVSMEPGPYPRKRTRIRTIEAR